MTTLKDLPLIIEPEQLEPLLNEPGLRIVDLCNIQLYQQLHIPGAVHVEPRQMISGMPPATGKLPAVEQLQQLFGAIGLHEDMHIVVYDDEGGGWAGRFIWTLDVIGHKNYSCLNGGIRSWLDGKHPVSNAVPDVEASQPVITINPDVMASAEYIMDKIGDQTSVVWDARSPEEYRGERILAQRGGRIPGAVNYEWTRSMDFQNSFRIRDSVESELAELGITADKEIITHCQTHHRSGYTYLVAKALGFKNVRAYDGSWSEWGNRADTPVEM